MTTRIAPGQTQLPIQPVNRPNGASRLPLPRYDFEMATGSGKTVVMAMLTAWTLCNRGRRPGDERFPAGVLAVCPNLTVKERLQVLRPERADNYHEQFDLVPTSLLPELRKGRVRVENWHRFAPSHRTPTVAKRTRWSIKARKVPRRSPGACPANCTSAARSWCSTTDRTAGAGRLRNADGGVRQAAGRLSARWSVNGGRIRDRRAESRRIPQEHPPADYQVRDRAAIDLPAHGRNHRRTGAGPPAESSAVTSPTFPAGVPDRG